MKIYQIVLGVIILFSSTCRVSYAEDSHNYYQNIRDFLDAAETNNAQLIKDFLINKKVDPNVRGLNGNALIIASFKGNDSVVEELLADERVDPNTRNYDDLTPLMAASGYGHPKVVKLLLADKRVDPNLQQNRNGYTALAWGVEKRHLDVVEEFMKDEKVNLNVKDENGFTPLMLATNKNEVGIVKAFLANKNIDPNVQGYGIKRTALMIACIKNYLDIIREFMANTDKEINAVDPNIKDNMGLTALMLAILNDHPEAEDIILENKKVVDMKPDKAEVTKGTTEFVSDLFSAFFNSLDQENNKEKKRDEV